LQTGEKEKGEKKKVRGRRKKEKKMIKKVRKERGKKENILPQGRGGKKK